MNKSKVFVSSRSFSSNIYLKKKLLSIYPNSYFNTLNRRLTTDEFINLAKNNGNRDVVKTNPIRIILFLGLILVNNFAR